MRILTFLTLILGLTVFVNAQNENFFGLKGKIIYQRINTNEDIKISFQNEENHYQAKVKNDNSFEINLPKGIYQVEITVTNISSEIYQFKNKNIESSASLTFNVKSADSLTVACPIVEMSDIFIETKDIKLSSEIILKPLENLPKAQNKTKRKTNNNK